MSAAVTPGAADRVIDGSERAVIPSHPSIHHTAGSTSRSIAGCARSTGCRRGETGLFERSQAMGAPDAEGGGDCAEFTYCELLLSGVTSLVAVSAGEDGWIELLARQIGPLHQNLGAVGPRRRPARRLHRWDEQRARAGMDRALKGATPWRASERPVVGLVSPMQIDTCTADLLRDGPGGAARDPPSPSASRKRSPRPAK